MEPKARKKLTLYDNTNDRYLCASGRRGTAETRDTQISTSRGSNKNTVREVLDANLDRAEAA